jgi:hypothetical protein
MTRLITAVVWGIASLVVTPQQGSPKSLAGVDTQSVSGNGRVLRKSDNREVGRFEGWPAFTIPPSLVVLTRSMVHFAPAPTFRDRLRPNYLAWEKASGPRGYGYDPAWFNVSHSAFSCDPTADRLTFTETMTSNHPASGRPHSGTS